MTDVTLSVLFLEYELYKNVKDVSKAKARAAFDHLVAFTGDIPANKLGCGTVNKWATYLAKTAINRRTGQPGLSAATIHSSCRAAASVFGWAMRQRLANGANEYGLTNNPFADAERVAVDVQDVRFYTEAEAGDILAAAGSLLWRDRTKTLSWYAAIELAAICGLRKGEVLNLRWVDVDLDGGRVLIRHRVDEPNLWWAWTSKGKHEGEMPMSDGLWQTMSRLKELRPWPMPFVPLGRYRDLLSRPWPLPERVRDVPVDNWTRDFHRVLAAANRRRGLAGDGAIPHGDYHQLRKSLATWLAEAGLPEHYVQATLRHASAETTRKHYIGINRQQCLASIRRTINAIDL